VLLVLVGLLTGCARPADPGPADIREIPPPWTAPRDAVSYIAAAGLSANRPATSVIIHTVVLHVDVDGFAVAVPAEIGIDRARGLRASAYTLDTTGTITLAGRGADNVTLGQFFTLWGVRFANGCLGASCGDLYVTTSGERYLGNPGGLRLADVAEISISSRS
jgi:hypothetical protein